MRNVECEDCGKVPWLIESDDGLLVRCRCDTALLIAPSAGAADAPESWD